MRNRAAGSLLVLALAGGILGCGGGKDDEKFKSQKSGKSVAPAKMHHHDYGPGPHKGRMVDLGDDHQLVTEITYTKEPRKITVYVLDHNTQSKPMPIEAKSMTLELHDKEGGHHPVTLSAEPQSGEEEGKSSQFMVQGEAIPEFIEDVEDIDGHLNVQIGEKTVEAVYEEEEHEHQEK